MSSRVNYGWEPLEDAIRREHHNLVFEVKRLQE